MAFHIGSKSRLSSPYKRSQNVATLLSKILSPRALSTEALYASTLPLKFQNQTLQGVWGLKLKVSKAGSRNLSDLVRVRLRPSPSPQAPMPSQRPPLPGSGDRSTLKLATRSAECAVPGTEGPQSSSKYPRTPHPHKPHPRAATPQRSRGSAKAWKVVNFIAERGTALHANHGISPSWPSGAYSRAQGWPRSTAGCNSTSSGESCPFKLHQRHRDTETQRHRGTEAQRHGGTETQRHRDTHTHTCQVFPLTPTGLKHSQGTTATCSCRNT